MNHEFKPWQACHDEKCRATAASRRDRQAVQESSLCIKMLLNTIVQHRKIFCFGGVFAHPQRGFCAISFQHPENERNKYGWTAAMPHFSQQFLPKKIGEG